MSPIGVRLVIHDLPDIKTDKKDHARKRSHHRRLKILPGTFFPAGVDWGNASEALITWKAFCLSLPETLPAVG